MGPAAAATWSGAEPTALGETAAAAVAATMRRQTCTGTNRGTGSEARTGSGVRPGAVANAGSAPVAARGSGTQLASPGPGHSRSASVGVGSPGHSRSACRGEQTPARGHQRPQWQHPLALPLLLVALLLALGTPQGVGGAPTERGVRGVEKDAVRSAELGQGHFLGERRSLYQGYATGVRQWHTAGVYQGDTTGGSRRRSAMLRKGAAVGRAAANRTAQVLRRWPKVRVVTAAGVSDFGWVKTAGKGALRATVYQRTCFDLTALTRKGASFDHGAKRQAFFVAYVTKGEVALAADITYQAKRSSHRVCYTAPSTGTYTLDVRLVFTNTAQVVNTAVGGAARRGYARYTRVMLSKVKVSGPKGFDTWVYRRGLPLCTPQELTESQNRGFWVRSTWVPEACRLKRLEPSQVLQCMDKKRVFMLGDSQTRITFGVLQRYLNARSRADFVGKLKNSDYFEGDLLLIKMTENKVPQKNSGDRPPMNKATGVTYETKFDFMDGVPTTYYGNLYHGFVFQRVRTSIPAAARKGSGGAGALRKAPVSVDFNLTYSTYFDVRGPIFQPWQLEGDLTRGVLVTAGGAPVDLLFNANELHDIRNSNRSSQFAAALGGAFLPSLRPLLRDVGSLSMWGGMTSVEARLKNLLPSSANPRIVAFENAARRTLKNAKYPSFMKTQFITSPRPDLAYDSLHYIWPVSLAFIDLWLGPHCPQDAPAV